MSSLATECHSLLQEIQHSCIGFPSALSFLLPVISVPGAGFDSLSVGASLPLDARMRSTELICRSSPEEVHRHAGGCLSMDVQRAACGQMGWLGCRSGAKCPDG